MLRTCSLYAAQAGLGLLMGVDKVSKEVEGSAPVLLIEMQQLIQDVKMFAKLVPDAMREMLSGCSDYNRGTKADA